MSLLWNLGLSSVRRLRHFNDPVFSTGGNRIAFSTSSSSSIVRSSLFPSLSVLLFMPASLSSHHILPPLRLKSGVKTNSGCKKRFRVRGSGSIKRGKSGKSHNTGYKHRQRVNRLGSSTGIKGDKIEQRVRRLLNVYRS